MRPDGASRPQRDFLQRRIIPAIPHAVKGLFLWQLWVVSFNRTVPAADGGERQATGAVACAAAPSIDTMAWPFHPGGSMKKLALALALVFGLQGTLAMAQDKETITVAKTASSVTIGGMTVPIAAVVVGAVIAGVVVLAVTQNNDETVITVATATTT